MNKKIKNYYANTSMMGEAIRTLRTNLSFSSIDGKMKSIIITSAEQGDGKSTISVNLARSMAENGSKVLLIDCDLRNPSIGKVSGNSNPRGITNYLVREAKLEDIIMHDKKIPSLELILAGTKPPNPAELLSTNRMRDFVEVAKKNYDLVILDTPPVGILTDAAILSNVVDGTVLVVGHDKTKKTSISIAIKNLKNVGANIIGMVLNRVPVEKNSKYGYGYGYGNNGK